MIFDAAATSARIEPVKRLGEIICCGDPEQSEAENIKPMVSAGCEA
jgi:hypothetical protein